MELRSKTKKLGLVYMICRSSHLHICITSLARKLLVIFITQFLTAQAITIKH